MNEQFIIEVQRKMLKFLTNEQQNELRIALESSLEGMVLLDLEEKINQEEHGNNLLDLFLNSKRIEGCSEKTLSYYKRTIEHLLSTTEKNPERLTTEDLRLYLIQYQEEHNCSRVTMDNIRRILSNFFAWLEDEDYIIKSPVRRIHKVKTGKIIKDTYSDEELERMCDNCDSLRNLSIINMLSSTGMRIGEMVRLRRDDINFNERECLVLGKGNKERIVYFDARTKIHLQNYLEQRIDNNPYLFVSANVNARALSAGAIEAMLRKLGKKLSIPKVHPHKFRRTLATTAIDKGMPIEQVQQLLGHQKIDTTLQYAMVKQQNVKQSHRRYCS